MNKQTQKYYSEEYYKTKKASSILEDLIKITKGYQSMSEWSKKFEELKYYGGEMNEGGELFYDLCSLAYHMTGIGDNDDKIPIIYDWAKQWADESKEYDDSNGEDVFQYEWGC